MSLFELYVLFIVACNCTPLRNIMEESIYLQWIEVSEQTQQLPTLRGMIQRNNKTGFQFVKNSKLPHIKVAFKDRLNNIARVDVLTPRSNVKQIQLSYFDDNNQTIKDPSLQHWSIHHISDFQKENNTIDKLCPNIPFRGIQIDLLQTDDFSKAPNNVSLKVYIRDCEGVGGKIRELLLSLILHLKENKNPLFSFVHRD